MTRNVVIGFLVICLLIVGAILYFKSPPDIQKPPDKGAVEIPKSKAGDITIGDEKKTPALPKGYKPKAGDRIITITAKEDIKAGENIKILAPSDGNSFVLGDRGRVEANTDTSKIQVEEQKFKNPWLSFEPHVMFGASGNKYLEPSLWIGCSFVTLWTDVHLGAGLDRFNAGPFVGYEVWRQFNVFVQKPVIEMHDKPIQFVVGLSYRF